MSAGGAPRCTIVVPVRDRAGLTRQCLAAILADPPRTNFEIVVVDDASTDRTPAVLADLGDAVRVVTRSENGGFATACNEGAAAALGDPFILFLNNDTVPTPGWLDTLVAYADERPEAAVVGAKLLFPDDSVQHAGVVICQDGRARHLYAGFPADHPAVNRSRRFQAVTAACALVRREAFEQAGGFDTAFLNSLEDADLCLRIGEQGHEVHLCHEAVLYHLESVSRARSGAQAARNDKVFQGRWGERARRDDLDYYVADRLLRFRYRDSYPIGLEISPLLAAIGDAERRPELERMLDSQARHVAELLRETVRLSARMADIDTEGSDAGSAPAAAAPSTRAEFLRRVEEIEIQIHGLQTALAAGLGDDDGGPLFEPSELLGYRRLVTEIRRAASATIPAGGRVIVISRGDDELLDLDGRPASHFPQDDDGTYAGYHPEDGEAAVEQLERLRERGAEYLLLPSTALWWLDRYPELAAHLESRYAVAANGESCRIYRLAISHESREAVVRKGFEALNSRDSAAIQAASDPEAELTSRFGAIDGKTYHGHAGISDYLADMDAAWLDFRLEFESSIPAERDRLVVIARVKAVAKASGVPIDERTFGAYEFRDGKVLRVEWFASRDEALAAVARSG